MGFWKGAGKLLWEATKLTGKATAAAAGLAAKGTAAAAKGVYNHREQIAAGAAATARVAGKATAATGRATGKASAYVARKIYDHREDIAGATVGAARGTAGAARDASGHLITDAAFAAQVHKVNEQSRRYRAYKGAIDKRIRNGLRGREDLLDTLVVGGETLAAYVERGEVPAEILRAYELQYPDLAASRSFLDEVARLDAPNLMGLVSGVKGKLFEMQYVDYLNAGHLPSGYEASLSTSATQPGWDIAITGPDGAVSETIQAKATESVEYVRDAIEKYPQIDVVTTSEVHGHLVMQGYSDNVIDSGISEDALTATVESATELAEVSMDFVPSAVSLALIAFTSYSREDLTAYEKGHQMGERSAKTYLSYLAGGALAVGTGTWWIGVLGAMGSRYLLGSGRKKRERMAEIKELVRTNEVVLRRLGHQAS